VVTGNPRSIPTLGGTAMTLLGAMFLIVGLFVIRRPKWPAWSLLALLLPAGTAMADVFPLQVVLREAPAGPSPWAIVEGYDFASGSPPPISAMSVGQPVGAEYLLPVRAGGVFLSRLNTHHQSDRARLERTILLKYTSDANRQSALSALSGSGGIESVFVPLEQDRYFPVAQTSVPQSRSVTGSTPWRSLLDFPGAWEREQGWARVGVLDNGYDPSHPALVAIDPAGHLTGGNVISAGTLDIGDLGINQGVDFCDFFTMCDRNLDEAQPKAVPIGTECDVTAFDPAEDGVIRFEFVGHGTMTAGMIGAKPISGSVGPGACPSCGIWPIRTSTLLCIPLNDGGKQASLTPNPNAVIAGLTYLVNGGAQVVSSSNPNRTPFTGFCATNPNSPYCSALRLARLHGVLFVSAAGNHRTDIAFPASHASVLSAGGANEILDIWNEDTDPPPGDTDQCPNAPAPTDCGSNFTITAGSRRQEVLAPARTVDLTVYRGRDWNPITGCTDSSLGSGSDGIGTCSGTSFSAPMLAGLSGLILSANPLLLPGDPEVVGDAIGVRDVIVEATNRSLAGQPWTNTLGYGVPNAAVAVSRVFGTVAGRAIPNRVTPMFQGYSALSTDYAYSPTSTGFLALNNSNTSYVSDGQAVSGYPAFPHDPALPEEPPRARFFVLTSEKKPEPSYPNPTPLYALQRSRNWPVGCTPGDGCNDLNSDWLLASTVAHAESFIAQGYDYFHRQGFIYSPCSPEPSCIPPGAERLHRKCKFSEDDCAAFLERDRAAMEAAGYTAASAMMGYTYPNIDTDGDQLIDGFERILGTNPGLADSDGDGLADGLEYPQAGIQLSDPCAGPNVQCTQSSSLFSNGFE